MRIKLAIWILTVGLAMLPIPLIGAEPQVQMPPLPADLLFTTSISEEEGDYPRDIIVRVAAETLEVIPFYVDSEAFEIMPISWSPQGDLLAVYRIMPAIDNAFTLFPRQLCILDRAGVLQRCMVDSPPMYYGGDPQSWQHYYPVTWGTDGQTIYFDTEYPNETSPYGYGKRLVEASVITGETLRVVYEYPDPYPVSPSPDLSHAVVGFGGLWGGLGTPAFLVDLTTGSQIDVASAVPSLTKLYSTCLPVSPNGNYVTVSAEYDLATYAPDQDPTLNDGGGYLLIILDMQGTIQGIIGQPDGYDTLWSQDCPGWAPDEEAIFFWASDSERAYIMRYSLLDQQLTTVYTLRDWPERETNVCSPLIPSPDGTHIAITVSDGPYEDRLVAVLYPDGEIYRIPSPYRFGLYPLWIPPTSAPPPTPTPTPTETPTATPTATPTPDPVIFFDDFESETAAARRNRESDETEVRWVEWTVRMRAFIGFSKVVSMNGYGYLTSIGDELLSGGYEPINDSIGAGTPSNSSQRGIQAAFYPRDIFQLEDLWQAYRYADTILNAGWNQYDTNVIGYDEFYGISQTCKDWLDAGNPAQESECVKFDSIRFDRIDGRYPPQEPLDEYWQTRTYAYPRTWNVQNEYYDRHEADNYFLEECVHGNPLQPGNSVADQLPEVLSIVDACTTDSDGNPISPPRCTEIGWYRVIRPQNPTCS